MQKVKVQLPGGEYEYALAIALVHTKNDRGWPALVKIIYDDEEISLNGGEVFITLLLHADNVEHNGK